MGPGVVLAMSAPPKNACKGKAAVYRGHTFSTVFPIRNPVGWWRSSPNRSLATCCGSVEGAAMPRHWEGVWWVSKEGVG